MINELDDLQCGLVIEQVIDLSFTLLISLYSLYPIYIYN